MIRVIVDHAHTSTKNYKEFAGKSTDEKPTQNLITGSLFLEVDTMKLYAFDESGDGSWGDGIQLGSGS